MVVGLNSEKHKLEILNQQYYRIIWLFIFFIFSACSSATDNNIDLDKTHVNEVGMEFVPKIFEEVSLDSFEQSVCSPPDQESEWEGVVISIPERIIFTKELDNAKKSLPLCGYSMNNYSDLSSSPETIVIIRKHNSDFSKQVILESQETIHADPDPDEEPINLADMEGMVYGGYFNYNLFSYMDFPLGQGTYDITIQYAGKKSNTSTVEIVEK